VIFDDYLDAARDGWGSFQRLAGFLAPAIPVPLPLQPVAAAGMLLTLAATTGVALGSLALLLTSLLALYLLLTQVFGLEIRVANLAV
jgi:hypothetical protein